MSGRLGQLFRVPRALPRARADHRDHVHRVHPASLISSSTRRTDTTIMKIIINRKVRASVKSLKNQPDAQVVRRRGKVYVINKLNPRFKGRPG
ncbi:hypothetical protein GCM10025787_24230 [Saccharopolyspora rosea]